MTSVIILTEVTGKPSIISGSVEKEVLNVG